MVTVVGRLKQGLFRAARATGVSERIARSRWRRNRLLILCYHSISIRDEHRWRPNLFISQQRFAARLQLLADGGYRVLPLGEALQRARQGRLPPRSVCLTFDDGTTEFETTVWPLLKQYGFPATVYLTTYYAERPYPVFPVAIRYALWKTDCSHPIPDTEGRNGEELELEARRICDRIGFDWSELHRLGMFQIMAPEQVGRVSAEGCDIQLHTHRHRSPQHEELYRGEIRDNRQRIQDWTGTCPVHFCYPSGVHRPEFAGWLRREGVRSAVTTDPGLVDSRAKPYFLHRFVDTMAVTSEKFAAWLDGLATLLPRRAGR